MDKLNQALLLPNVYDSPPRPRVFGYAFRCLFLAMFLLAFPSVFSLAKSYFTYPPYADSDAFKSLHIILRDLVDEGLIKKGHNGVVLGSVVENNDLGFLRNTGIDLVIGNNKEITDQVFDFVFARSFHVVQQFDNIVKDNGLVIFPLGSDPSVAHSLLSRYKIVYLRRFESTVVAMRKMEVLSSNSPITPSKEMYNGMTMDEKKAALTGLEDVYLEPPMLGKISIPTTRKINFLPDLLKDSLDQYPRRIFISDEFNAVKWFYKNYPMRDQEFEVYSLEVGGVVVEEEANVSNWLSSKVKHEDYVVMKAEAQVVEEMLRDMTLYLVDELFMECKNQWQDEEETNVSKRAYWQCLALYGKVRDEGIAVHQWWNGL